MVRTVLSIAALALLSFILSGCDGGSTKSDSDVKVNEPPKEKVQSPSAGHGLGKQGGETTPPADGTKSGG